MLFTGNIVTNKHNRKKMYFKVSESKKNRHEKVLLINKGSWMLKRYLEK